MISHHPNSTKKGLDVEWFIDYPAKIADMLLKDEIDIGLVPVAIIPLLKESHIISNYGIACNGKVASVCLFSDVPIEAITTILLDYQSRTSVQLLKILLKEYWKKEVEFVPAEADYEKSIKGSTAGLVIGDRAFTQKNPYIYDLGEIWKLHTGLPFVFATWVSNKKNGDNIIIQFNEQIKENLEYYFAHIDGLDLEDYQRVYLQNNIQFTITNAHQKGLMAFLEKLT
jgi:chorismate dehydratase